MTEFTPEEIAQREADALNFAKQQAKPALNDRLNGLAHNIMSAYPAFEVQTWPYQRAEAATVLAAGEAATLEMAPMLTIICTSEFGEVSGADRLAQVKAKAAGVAANADGWGYLAGALIGLRSRGQALIEAATTPEDVTAAFDETVTHASELVA